MIFDLAVWSSAPETNRDCIIMRGRYREGCPSQNEKKGPDIEAASVSGDRRCTGLKKARKATCTHTIVQVARDFDVHLCTLI